MVAFPARRDRKKHQMTSDYRISRIAPIETLVGIPVDAFTSVFDKMVYEVSANYPAVTHYIVRADETDIAVGLHIEKVVPGSVESIADALLSEALAQVVQRLGLETPPQFEESELHLV